MKGKVVPIAVDPEPSNGLRPSGRPAVEIRGKFTDPQ